MERASSLSVLLLCCVVAFTAVGATSATSLVGPLLPRDDRPQYGAASSASAAAHARPLAWKGKTIEKYVAVLRPTKLNGKVVGDKGASAKVVLKVVRYSAIAYYQEVVFEVLNINSGGKAPLVSETVASCTTDSVVGLLPFTNITSDKAGRRKRYSFYAEVANGPVSKTAIRFQMDSLLARGRFLRAWHDSNLLALCGKLKKQQLPPF